MLMLGVAGVTVIAVSVGVVGGGVGPEPELPPQPTNSVTPTNSNDKSHFCIANPPGGRPPTECQMN